MWRDSSFTKSFALALLFQAIVSIRMVLSMNAKYFAALTIIVWAMGLSQSITYAQVPQLVVNSIFNDEPPLLEDQGAPGDRRGAATRIARYLGSDRFFP